MGIYLKNELDLKFSFIFTVAFDLPKKLAKGPKSKLPPVDDVLSKKCFKGLPLKFYVESNGAIKIFGY